MTGLPPHDLAILGGGCAGLALAARLARLPSPPRTIIVEPREGYENDRTWCFWAGEDHEFSPLVSRRWPRWRLSAADGRELRQSAPGVSYQLLAAGDFYAYALEEIAAAPAIELALGASAGAITAEGPGVRIETSAGPISARQVIDTRPQPGARALLWQAFAGVEIEAALGEPEVAGVMCDMRVEPDGFAFDYILPLDEERTLFELTFFTAGKPGREVPTRVYT